MRLPHSYAVEKRQNKTIESVNSSDDFFALMIETKQQNLVLLLFFSLIGSVSLFSYHHEEFNCTPTVSMDSLVLPVEKHPKLLRQNLTRLSSLRSVTANRHEGCAQDIDPESFSRD